MIYKLQRKFIWISAVSVLSVIVLVFLMICFLNVFSMNRNLDILADKVSEGGGRFPSAVNPMPEKRPPAGDREENFITPETPFATRHFTVLFNSAGEVEKVHTESIASITEESAIEYAKSVLSEKKMRGWQENYRYKIFSSNMGQGVVFIDGGMSRASLLQSMTIAGAVLLSCAALVLLLIVLLSKHVVKPIADSYEKQKQFVTDAGHELKTPLTLILANLDIAESELGKNEWLEDIRAEGHRMTALVNQMVALSRMDEEKTQMQLADLSLSDTVADAASEFCAFAERAGKKLRLDIEPQIMYRADEALMRRLIAILLDNAVKYCDEGGEIVLKLARHRRIVLTVENTYAGVSDLKLDCLFDRFYRADKARTYTGGYGIGLSIAKAIVSQHKGEILAYQRDEKTIGFKVLL